MSVPLDESLRTSLPLHAYETCCQHVMQCCQPKPLQESSMQTCVVSNQPLFPTDQQHSSRVENQMLQMEQVDQELCNHSGSERLPCFTPSYQGSPGLAVLVATHHVHVQYRNETLEHTCKTPTPVGGSNCARNWSNKGSLQTTCFTSANQTVALLGQSRSLSDCDRGRQRTPLQGNHKGLSNMRCVKPP